MLGLARRLPSTVKYCFLLPVMALPWRTMAS